ncbi:MAG: lipoate--protein ligase family protein, partial [Chloroflexi bacterium]|nr:lipoate--protein ligase family protein [Chloroflexota bacterium]
GSVLTTYHRISEGLIAGLRHLGVRADLAADAMAQAARGAACFATPSIHEIKVNGRKLVGSAQMVSNGAVLQHGSIPLTTDAAQTASVFCVASAEERSALSTKLREHSISLEEALGRGSTFAEVVAALRDGFAQALGIDLLTEELTPTESELAEQLRREKYSRDDWNLRR